MYDPKSEPSEFIAASREEAIAKACQFFGVEASELVVRELPPGIAGAASRVVVVAQPEGARAARPARRAEPRDRVREERRGGRDDRPRDDRREGRGRERRFEERPPRGERHREREERPREAGAAGAEPVEESVGRALGDLQLVGRFVLGAVERMDLGPFEIREAEEEQLIVYQLLGPAAERMAGGEGRAGDALQLVANQAALRIAEDHKRVVVDVEGDRTRREEFLARVADRAARRAEETGRAVALDPMNAKDRRGIHVALRGRPGIATMSIGSGRYRQVVVVPEGAPEYEEARRLAEQASAQEG